MEIQNPKAQKILKKIKSPNFIYLTVFFVFLAIVSLLFLYSTNFIVANINKIFSPTNDGDQQALNIDNYSLVAKRLGLPVNVTADSVAASSTTKTSAAPVLPGTAIKIPMSSVTLSVLNSTGKKGIASTLAASLRLAGFSKITTGNQKKLELVTTILVKDTSKEFASLVEAVVKKTYPKAVTNTTPSTEASDITIIIGQE